MCASEPPNIEFFTEYNFAESRFTDHDRARFPDAPSGLRVLCRNQTVQSQTERAERSWCLTGHAVDVSERMVVTAIIERCEGYEHRQHETVTAGLHSGTAPPRVGPGVADSTAHLPVVGHRYVVAAWLMTPMTRRASAPFVA